jgi:alpha-glucosidase (family GH31 glycosyl hydrolase)
MLRNVSGIYVDYETFKAEYDSIPQMKKIVDRFDATGITLKTKAQPTDTQSQDQSNIMSTAKRAATKTLQQPG